MAKDRQKPQAPRRPQTISNTPSTPKVSTLRREPAQFIFGKQNFIWMGIGLGFILLGLLCMMGGQMPKPDVWDESIIYSPLRITIAPLLMIAGFIIEIYAIFKKSS